MADAGGPIELVVTSVNSARRATLANAALVEAIVNALPESVHVLILTNDRAAFTVAANPAPERVEFVELPADNPLTIWPQDPFLVLGNDAGAHRLLASKRFERAGDAKMAEVIADTLGWPVSTSALIFEGGNIVVDESHAFIGENTVRYNAVELGIDAVDVVAMFERELGATVSIIGPAPQPIPHIDMMLTPLGDGAIVVADSRWGADIAANALADTPKAVEAFERTSEREFFGHPEIRERAGPDGTVLGPPPLVGATAGAIAHSRAIGDYLDALAATLGERGHDVHRVPLLLSSGSYGDARDDARRERPFVDVLDYPVLTYNNVLLETRSGRPAAYVPRYGLAELDENAHRRWRSLGYDVIPVPGFTTSALYGGALRCSVKVLRRGRDRGATR